jgi:hypothetical protein
MLIVDFCKYILGVSILDVLTDTWSTIPITPVTSIDISGNITNIVDISGNQEGDDEVFNIRNNLYTYDDAKAICKSYGARLATYDDIEKSYNKGGEWCNYGWSENQMIFFPTQKSTWEKLQSNPNTKNNCGRPGINGGYMANPYIKFGVNCYGKKPKAKDSDISLMKAQNNQVQPQTPQDAALDKKVQFWKENADKLLLVNSFNTDKWSQY